MRGDNDLYFFAFPEDLPGPEVESDSDPQPPTFTDTGTLDVVEIFRRIEACGVGLDVGFRMMDPYALIEE